MSPENKRAITVGLFILVGLVFLAAAILAVGSITKAFVSNVTVSTIFKDVNGITAGNNIWYSGVKVGTVKKVQFHGNSEVEVIMNIEEKSKDFIRKDAKVKISSDGLIGNKILVITGGSTNVPSIENGDKLQIEETTSSEDMMNTLQSNNVNLLAITENLKVLSNKIRDGEGTIGKVISEDALYNELFATLNTLKSASVNANKMVASLNSFTASLNKEGNFAHDLVTDTTIMVNLKQASSQINTLTVQADGLLKKLDETTAGLNKSLQSSSSPAGVLLNDEATARSLKETIRNLESSTDKLDENMLALRSNFLFRKYFRKQAKAAAKADTTNN